MTKKLQLFCLTLFSSLLIHGQTTELRTACGSPVPPQQWEDWMSKEVEKFKAAQANSKTQQVNYTIPVIVHIIANGEAVGTFPNIDSNQVKSQIKALNDDFAGIGLNTGSTPSAFTGSLAGNTGIKFCLAQLAPNNSVLVERGIQRINTVTNTWGNPNTPTTNIQSYIVNTVVPSYMWDPTKYLNIWISERSPTLSINGFATYPSGTSLTGLYSGTLGTTSYDGIWINTAAFGTIGQLNATVNEGRTLTHEVGHWLGLRHIWGDGNCLSDYCNDTPWSMGPNTGCPGYPVNIDHCGVGQSPLGEMTMNFMDMTNDSCRYMFTHDQATRMQVAMSQCTNRNLLGTHGLCYAFTAPSSSAIPSFELNASPCVGTAFTPSNTSSGYPPPSYIWSSTPPANFYPNPTVANPAITFNSPGTYTLSLVATNTVSNGTYTMVIQNVPSTCPAVALCIDTLRKIRNTDSLMTYKTTTSTVNANCLSGFAGYMTGTNCYQDKEYAQFFPYSSYSNTPYPQVNSVIVLFDSVGTKVHTNPPQPQMISCKIYGGTISNGPVSAMAVKQTDLANIVATPKVNNYPLLGNPNQIMSLKRIIPYKFDFVPPAIVNSPNNGFFVAIDVPQVFAGDSVRIFSNSIYTPTTSVTVLDSSAWALTYNNLWRPLKSYRKARVQLAIMPEITCSPIVGIKEQATAFNSNIAVVPNPNNGVFSLVFTLPQDENLYVRVYNAMGQEISASHLQNIRNSILDVNLSEKPEGIYFTEISNGNERVVKKVIVSH